MTSSQLIPALVAPLLIWRFYRRFRSNIGRQNYRPKRSMVFVVLITLLSAFIAFAVFRVPMGLFALLGGLAVGATIGVIGIKLTEFEVTSEGKFYTPNPYLGIAVSLLLVGRLIYRFMVMGPLGNGLPPSGPAAGQSPLTLAITGITFGYYIAFSSGLVLRLGSAKTGEMKA